MISLSGYELKMMINAIGIFRRGGTDYDPTKYRFRTNLKIETFNANRRDVLVYSNFAKAIRGLNPVLLVWLNPILHSPTMVGRAVTLKQCRDTYLDFSNLLRKQQPVPTERGFELYEAEKKEEAEFGSLLLAFWLARNEVAQGIWLKKYEDVEGLTFLEKDWRDRVMRDFVIANYCLYNSAD